jgi:hypothetical protein
MVTIALVSSEPDTTRTSPLGRVVVVGYQRPRAIAPVGLQPPVVGSKIVAVARPWLLVM